MNTIPAGLKHQCFMAECVSQAMRCSLIEHHAYTHIHAFTTIHTHHCRLYRRIMEAEAHGMVHAASNPMAIKRANDDTFEAQVDQARKGLTPRRARKVKKKPEGIAKRNGIWWYIVPSRGW